MDWSQIVTIILALIAGTGTAWGISRQSNASLASKALETETAAQQLRADTATKLQASEEGIRKWLSDTIDILRHNLKASEDQRIEDAKKCEERLDYQRKRHDVLQDKYDADMKQIRGSYEKVITEFGNYRVEAHDMRGELLAFKQTGMPGGKRYLDPPKAGSGG